MIEKQKTPSFSVVHMLRLSSFQVGSAMGDILVTSIWNRVMISNFGIPAAPVSLLIALRYLLSPLSLWAGFLSDQKPLWGMRRISYIWLGRGLMVLSLPLLGISLGRLESATGDFWGWALAAGSSLIYGSGTLISGSPYLALVRDSAPEKKQGLAISMAQTALIVCFAAAGIGFSFWMESYSYDVFWQMIWTTMVVGGFFWVFSIFGAEKRQGKMPTAATVATKAALVGFAETMRQIWHDRRARRFFFFLSLATLSAWAQDAILEPFGAEVFDLPVARTTRLNSYWQGATVVTLIGGAYLWRRRPPERQSSITMLGLSIMAAGMFFLGLAVIAGHAYLIEVALVFFGGGFGIYTFGGVSLMAVMASTKDAGAYLGLWSVSILVFKGLGTFLGGGMRDLLLLQLQLPAGTSYVVVFVTAAIGLIGSVLLLYQVDVVGFADDMGRTVDLTEAQLAIAD